MSCSEKSSDAPIIGNAGVAPAVAPPADPFQALDDLMVVVEELCPVWPPRPIFTNESSNRL